MEKIYKTMKISGSLAITIGIIMIVIGSVIGSISIVIGAKLLNRKNDIVF